jgi:hypothetical protein
MGRKGVNMRAVLLGLLSGAMLGVVAQGSWVSALTCSDFTNINQSHGICCNCGQYDVYTVDRIRNDGDEFGYACLVATNLSNVDPDTLDYYNQCPGLHPTDTSANITILAKRYNKFQTASYDTEVSYGGPPLCNEHSHNFEKCGN